MRSERLNGNARTRTKRAKKSEVEEQQFNRAKRKMLVQEDQEREWKKDVKSYLLLNQQKEESDNE